MTSNSYRLDKKLSFHNIITLAAENQVEWNTIDEASEFRQLEMEDEGGGLFNIEVCSEDEGPNESEKVPRDFQSEEDFQWQRAEWKPKIEVPEVRIASLLH